MSGQAAMTPGLASPTGSLALTPSVASERASVDSERALGREADGVSSVGESSSWPNNPRVTRAAPSRSSPLGNMGTPLYLTYSSGSTSAFLPIVCFVMMKPALQLAPCQGPIPPAPPSFRPSHPDGPAKAMLGGTGERGLPLPSTTTRATRSERGLPHFSRRKADRAV